jgi:hypothetical protein
MKTVNEIVLVVFIFGSAEYFWYGPLQADQAGVDDGVNYAKGLIGNVQDIGTNTNINTVPGYGGTNLPLTDYYSNQDLNGLQTDAVIGVNSGTANEASLYAYEKAQQPKLTFGASDPILLNSGTISTDAILNPDVLTVKTGDCAVTSVTGDETRIETCTAWMSPTTHVCGNTLNVDVTWESISSCPIGTGFAQGQATINTSHVDDIVYARAYCNPGVGDGLVALQVDASDGDSGDCTGWTDISVSTNQTTTSYTGALLRPKFTSFCTYVPVFGYGSCDASDNCSYSFTYHQLTTWIDNDGTMECNGQPVDLTAQGFPGGLANSYTENPWSSTGDYCAFKSTAVSLNFEKPNVTQTPTVTDTWNDSCGMYEAQIQ